jgi:hypothetical protein
MYSPQKRYHRFRRKSFAVFWSDDNFAFVFCAAKEEAECAFDLFLGCEFFYNFM